MSPKTATRQWLTIGKGVDRCTLEREATRIEIAWPGRYQLLTRRSNPAKPSDAEYELLLRHR